MDETEFFIVQCWTLKCLSAKAIFRNNVYKRIGMPKNCNGTTFFEAIHEIFHH